MRIMRAKGGQLTISCLFPTSFVWETLFCKRLERVQFIWESLAKMLHDDISRSSHIISFWYIHSLTSMHMCWKEFYKRRSMWLEGIGGWWLHIVITLVWVTLLWLQILDWVTWEVLWLDVVKELWERCIFFRDFQLNRLNGLLPVTWGIICWSQHGWPFTENGWLPVTWDTWKMSKSRR